MILTDREIQIAIKTKQIVIDPIPGHEAYSPTSIDLSLDIKAQRWRAQKSKAVEPPVICPGSPGFSFKDIPTDYIEDFSIQSDGYVVEPNGFFLGWTRENVNLPQMSRIATVLVSPQLNRPRVRT